MSQKTWGGRFSGATDNRVEAFTESITFDRRLYAHDIAGWRMEFSSFDRFFQAIHPLTARLPLFVGELQHHAVGCYSVYRPVKTAVRRAEHLLAQAQSLGEWDPQTRAAPSHADSARTSASPHSRSG